MPPSVTQTAATPPTGNEGIGATIPITLTFSEPVTVSGVGPSLTLNDGGSATYIGGSGTNTLTFHYTVGLNDTSTGALAITGVTDGTSVTDAAGNPANFTGALSTFTGLRIDTTQATHEWLYGASGDWSNAANWVSGAVPGPSDDVLINSYGQNISVTVSQPESAGSLMVINQAITGNGSLTIGSGLTMSGASITGTGDISASSLTMNGSSIQGAGDISAGY